MQPRRATPMYLVDDMDDARLRYIGLGFVPAPSDDNEGCCGISAGQTHIILINRDHAERTCHCARSRCWRSGRRLCLGRVAGRGSHLGLDQYRYFSRRSEHRRRLAMGVSRAIRLLVFAETTRQH